jgi:nicotinate-nucleotide pyrophosphorylase (carboxylating)
MNLQMNELDKELVQIALKEDIGTGDISASILKSKEVEGKIISREDCVVCGIKYANAVFEEVDKNINVNWLVSDGDEIKSEQEICHITGPDSSIVTAERIALNFLQTLSGISTQTKKLVNLISESNARILDTRKTIPGLRTASKYAVSCGGGVNHRMGLYDAFLIKENHIEVMPSLCEVIKSAKHKDKEVPIIVEVEEVDQLKELMLCEKIDRVLCDNFSLLSLKEAVELVNELMPIEASGNITEENIKDIAQTGVDYISIGSITKNIRAIDLSLRLV